MFEVDETFSLAKPNPGAIAKVVPPEAPGLAPVLTPALLEEDPDMAGVLPPVEDEGDLSPVGADLPIEVWASIRGLVGDEAITSRQMEVGEDPDPIKPPDEIEDKWQDEVLSLLREQDCYEFYKIEIGLGRNSTAFKDYRHTGSSFEMKNALKGIRANKQTFAMMEGLEEARKILTEIRGDAQDLMAWTGHSWLAPEKAYFAVAEVIENRLKPTAEELRSRLVARRSQEMQRYLALVAAVLVAARADLVAKGEEPFDIDAALEHYAAQFPTAKDIATNMRIRVIGPKRIPKLADQAQHYAELQTALAALEAAALQGKENVLKQKQLKAAQQLLQDEQAAGQRAIARAMEWAEGKMLEAFEDFFSRFDFKNLKPGDLSANRKESIQQALAQIESIMGKPGTDGFTAFMDDAHHLTGMAGDANHTKAEIEAKIEAMKAALAATVAPASGGIGHRAFAGSMIGRKKT